MIERVTLYSPNGKHGVNTLNCNIYYEKDKNPIYPKGWQVLTNEQLQGLNNKTLAWENDKLVPYLKSAEEISKEAKEARVKAINAEISEINDWFNNIYDQQIKQAERAKRMGVLYDNKYGTVEELDALAVEKAIKLNQLRNELRIEA
jgi:hypothetical protein